MSRPSSSRRGYLLTEMLVVISVSSVLAAVAVGLLATLVGVERVGRRHFEATGALARLSKQFRRDVAAAEEASVADENQGQASKLSLEFAGDRTVTYRVRAGRLLRLEEAAQAPAAREMFSLPATAEARFAIDDSQSGRFVVLSLDGPRAGVAQGDEPDAEKKRRRLVARDGVSRRGWTIEALLGRDARHSQLARETERSPQEPAP